LTSAIKNKTGPWFEPAQQHRPTNAGASDGSDGFIYSRANRNIFAAKPHFAVDTFPPVASIGVSKSMNNKHDKILFWGCFIALITTSYAFISRMILCGGQFKTDFGLDNVNVGELQGAGIWPFGVSIIIFSLFIDRIGYKVAMIFPSPVISLYTAMAFGVQAIHGRDWAVATCCGAEARLPTALLGQHHPRPRQRQRGGLLQSHRLHDVQHGQGEVAQPPARRLAGRPRAGRPLHHRACEKCRLALNLGLILIPAVTFFFILIGLKFPKSEREQAGVSYLAMLKELGAFGAFVGFGLVFAQLGQVFGWSKRSWSGDSHRRGRAGVRRHHQNLLAGCCSRFSSSS
jgi:hypothetical protein